MATTPTYGWEYQTLADAPNGATLGENLALDVEATVAALAATVTAADAVLTAADAALDARLDIIEAAWSDWVPTLTNLTLGNATQIAKYRQIGKTVEIIWRFTLGNTSAVGTAPRVSLPVNVAAALAASVAIAPFNGELHDVSASAVAQVLLSFPSASAVDMTYYSGALTQASITAAAPWAWATGDQLMFWGQYYTD